MFELEMAFNSGRLWGQEFVCDFGLLLNDRSHYVPLELSEKESDVSLITGNARLMPSFNKEDESNNKQSLIKRDQMLSVIHYSGAGNRINIKLSLRGFKRLFKKNTLI